MMPDDTPTPAGDSDATGKTEDGDAELSGSLSEKEGQEVVDRKAGSSRIIHEVIRIEGEEELARPWDSLMFSGFAAGVAITASVLAEADLHAALPDAPWRHPIESLGYTFGFIIVVMARMQLFTESTVTAVLPVATHPGLAKLAKMLRLWAIVLASNLAGTLAVSLLIDRQLVVTAEQRAAVIDLARLLFAHDGWTILWFGIPSGFLIGAMAWILPNARESQFWVILALSYLIALGGLSHVVAGSTEAWVMWLSGGSSLGHALFGVMLPSLIGNIIGGTGLFAVLAHGQVRGEIDTGSSESDAS